MSKKGFSNMMEKIQNQIQEETNTTPPAKSEKDEVKTLDNKASDNKTAPIIQLKKAHNIKKVNTSLRLTHEAQELLRELSLTTGNKNNTILTTILEQLYDETTRKFKIDIPKQEKQSNDSVPIFIREDILSALKINAELRNMSIGDYFSKLFLAASKYID